MAERLRVDYVQVESLITDMKSCEANVENIYEEMTNTVSSLVNNGYMEADAATAYVEEFKQMLGPDIENLSDLITRFHSQLSQVCQNFAEADSKLAKMLF